LKDLEQGSSSKEDTGEAWDGRELEGREVAKSRTDAEMWEERRWLANREEGLAVQVRVYQWHLLVITAKL
jgi:hypothetical protein